MLISRILTINFDLMNLTSFATTTLTNHTTLSDSLVSPIGAQSLAHSFSGALTSTVQSVNQVAHVNNSAPVQRAGCAGVAHWIAQSESQCFNHVLGCNKKHLTAPAGDERLWCNATWDTVLCWPAVPAGENFTLPCPPMKGLDQSKNVTKICHISGFWAVDEGRGMVLGDPKRTYGWTDYRVCFTPEWLEILQNMKDTNVIRKAQDIAKVARYLEFIGLSLSFAALIISLLIFGCVGKLRVFRNRMHMQLKLAILLITVVRLILYIDGAFTQQLGHLQVTDIGLTINTSQYICEAFYILLEYAKTVAAGWALFEGFFLHNCLVWSVLGGTPKLYIYCLMGWGLPLVHVTIWLILLYHKHGADGVPRCLGPYYLNTEIWILDGVRLLELSLSFLFLLNIIRVLWSKVRHSSSCTYTDNSYRKSIKAALMLMPLLGIPNILQLIPLHPTKENIFWFAVYTYVATFFYMYQGLSISMIYCFTNREVIEALKTCYGRYRLSHSSVEVLRRGSRAPKNYLNTSPNGNATFSGVGTPRSAHNSIISLALPPSTNFVERPSIADSSMAGSKITVLTPNGSWDPRTNNCGSSAITEFTSGAGSNSAYDCDGRLASSGAETKKALISPIHRDSIDGSNSQIVVKQRHLLIPQDSRGRRPTKSNSVNFKGADFEDSCDQNESGSNNHVLPSSRRQSQGLLFPAKPDYKQPDYKSEAPPPSYDEAVQHLTDSGCFELVTMVGEQTDDISPTEKQPLMND